MGIEVVMLMGDNCWIVEVIGVEVGISKIFVEVCLD